MGCFACFAVQGGGGGGGDSNGGKAKNFLFAPQFNDPFTLPHLGDQLNLPPIESPYRTKSGCFTI